MKVNVFNPSTSSFEIVSKRRTIRVPGRANPVEINIPDDAYPGFVARVSKFYPHVSIEATGPEPAPAPAPEPVAPAIEPAPVEETTAPVFTPVMDPEPVAPEPAPAVPDRDEFFAACKAVKDKDGVDQWLVKTPDGRQVIVTGVTHHLQAKQAAYDRFYEAKK